MAPFSIRNESDYRRALSLVEALWNAEPGTPAAEVLDLMSARIESFEAKELDAVLPPANPREVIAAKLRELGMSQRALGKRLGWSTGRVSEVLSGKRALTLAMVRALAPALGIRAGLLVEDCETEADAPTSVSVPRALVTRAEAAGYCGDRSLSELVARALAGLLGPSLSRSTTVPWPRSSPANNEVMFLGERRAA